MSSDPAEAPVTRAEAALYEERSVSLEEDELSQHQRMRRFYGRAALGLGGLLAASQLQNWLLSREIRRVSNERPVNTVVVGKDTGATYLVREQVGPPPEAEEPLIKHMAWQFVSHREQWTLKEDEEHYHVVQACCSADEQKRFKKWWEEDPKGPRKMCNPNGEARIVTRGEPRLLRSPYSEAWDMLEYPLSRAVVPAGANQSPQVSELKIVITFGWTKLAIRDDVRLPNPYGWVVKDYRREWAKGGSAA